MSDIKLIIGNKNYSSWSLRAWFFLKQFNIPFEEIRLPLRTEQYHQEIVKYSPIGQVPVLKHDNVHVWDSFAICDYVSEFLLDGKGWPLQYSDKALARSISAEMHSGFNGIRNQLPMNCRAVKKNYKLDATTRSEIQRVQNIWRQCLENKPKGSWLFGDFSIADTMYAPIVSRFFTYQIELDDTAKQYVDFVRNNEYIQEWLNASAAESEIIENSEVGEDI